MHFRTVFTFACRDVTVDHPTFCGAVKYARHVLTVWKSPDGIQVRKGRRENYDLILTVIRKTA